MESLILLFAELLLAPLIIGVSLLADLISIVVGFFLHLLTEKPSSKNLNSQTVLKSKISKWIFKISGGLIAATLFALLLVNLFFLDESVRWMADRVESKTGFSIEYATVEGNAFTGYFSFSEVELHSDQDDKPLLDLRVESLEANLSLLHFLSGDRVLDFANVDGADIRFESRKPKRDGVVDKLPFGFEQTSTSEGKEGLAISAKVLDQLKLPRYAINHLTLSRIEVEIIDNTAAAPVRYPISIESMEAKPIRSLFVWFDILFRANLNATIDGANARIVNSSTQNGVRHTQWTIEGTSAKSLASLIGGPFSIFQSGAIDVSVSDDWTFKDRDHIQMDWLLRAENARVALPPSTPKLLQPLAQVAVDNINKSQKPWEFGFQLELSEAQFMGAASLNARQIWNDSLPIVLKQIANLFDTDESTIKEKGAKAFDTLKGFLEKRRENE